MPEGTKRQRVQLYDGELPVDPSWKRPDTDYSLGKVSPNDLSKIEMEFCWRWTSHYDPGLAAIQAGYEPARSRIRANKLLADPRIKKQVALIEADRFRRMKFDGDKFLAEELALATASATALQEVWIPPCRHCYGRNFQYQRTYAEFEEAYETWMRMPSTRRRGRPPAAAAGDVLVYDDGGNKIPFDQQGGDGYNVELPPNPGCPNCFGRGLEIPGFGSVGHVRLRDTRELSDVGKLLYAGAKYGPRGLEVLTRNPDAARHRIMGMMAKFLELRAEGGGRGPGQPAIGFELGVNGSVADLLTNDPKSFTDQQLDAFLMSNGVVITDDGQAGEGDAGGGDSGEAPPPGYVA